MAELNTEINKDFRVLQEFISVPFKVSSTCYEKLRLPALPDNFVMCMMNIDYPDKAKENPNGSLFMKPTEEILRNTGSDIGNLFFGGLLKWDNIYNWTINDVKESYNIYKNNDVVKYLTEILGGTLTDDNNNDVLGKEINQHTYGRVSAKNAKPFDGSPIDAIDKYITRSISIVELLARAIVGGKELGEIKKLVTTISLFNSLYASEISDYLDENNEVLKLLKNSEAKKITKLLGDVIKIVENIGRIYLLCNSNKYATIYSKNLYDGLRKNLEEIINTRDNETKILLWESNKLSIFSDISHIVLKPIKNIEALNDFIEKGKNNTSFTEQIQYTNSNILFEDINENAAKQLKEFDFDKIFNKVQSTIREIMVGICVSNPEEWQIVLNAKTRMDKLKEACDKEINAKIELICRTAANGQSTLGEKFKSAISKHPMRAEGLKNIWARYSDDLNDRIESRIRSIGGMNGNSSIFMTIKHFLEDTYPALIAMLITWKCILQLCKEYTNKFPSPVINAGDKQQILNNCNNLAVAQIRTILSPYFADSKYIIEN